MDMRFKLAAVGFLVAMLVLAQAQGDMMHGFMGIFVTLGILLVFAVVALFPSINRGDNADRSKAGGGWSDRIEFKDSQNDAGDGGWR